ncbi:MAG: PDZ domain-containing protein [Gemmataceae bacterium]
MDRIGKRFFAAVAVLGFAAVFTGVGITLASAQETKTPDLSDLRDAVKAADKRGANVIEISKALDALEQAVAKGWNYPKPGATVPAPAELVALRDAVEAAARKGEAVEAIAMELEAVEKAMTGQVLTRPKPAPPVDPPVRPEFPIRPVRPFPQPFPVRPVVRPGVNPADIQKAQDLMRKAVELRLKNPDDPEAQKLLDEARELMLKAIAGGGIGMPDIEFPAPAVNRPRLGIRMERLTPVVMEQLGLEAGVGIAVAEVVEGSVAEKVGFKAHDIVIEFAGKPVGNEPGDLSQRVNEVRAGQKVTAVVLRKGKKVEIKDIELPAVAPQIQPRIDLQPLIDPKLFEQPLRPERPRVPDLRRNNGQPEPALPDEIQPKRRQIED